MKPKDPKKIQDFLKPRAGKIQQGYFRPVNPDKYLGDPNKIIFRSSWEFKFLKWCDSSPTVIEYSSEPFAIPYFNPIDERVHKYYIDFYMVVRESDGSLQKYLIEVKPSSQVAPPIAPTKLTDNQIKSYMYATKQYIINSAKFEAASDFAKNHGLKFGIITEQFLFKTI